MPVLMIMEWEGVSLEQYDELRRITEFETDHPEGGMFHVAALDGDHLRVADLWESAAAFQKFVDTRLVSAASQLGIQTQPKTHVLEVHNMFTPGFQRK